MQYLRVKWIHSHPTDPVEIWSELDESGWEVRKVEVFADGTIGFASDTESTNSTVLGEAPVPPLADIAANPAFKPSPVTKNEFERTWANRFSSTPKTHVAPPAD